MHDTCAHTHMHTHTHTLTHTNWAFITCRDFGFLFLILFSQIVHVHDVHRCAHTHTHAHKHTCTHTHTHTLTHTHRLGLYHLQTLGSYFSHKVYMCMNGTRLCTHTCTHAYMHTHSHTHRHTHTDWTCTTCSDFGSYFSHCIHKACTCARTHLHCYVNSPYTIFVTNTHTHTHSHAHTQTGLCTTCRYFGFLFLSLFSQIVHVHECTQMCTHTCICTHTRTHTHRLGLYHFQ